MCYIGLIPLDSSSSENLYIIICSPKNSLEISHARTPKNMCTYFRNFGPHGGTQWCSSLPSLLEVKII